MKDNTNIQEQFHAKLFGLSEQTILEMNRLSPDGSFNNVIRGLRKECFGIYLENSKKEEEFCLTYITAIEGELQGELLKLNLKEKNRDNLTAYFARYLSESYKVNFVEVFNTYQHSIQTMAEQLGYFTLTAAELEPYMEKNPSLLIPSDKGLIVLKYLSQQEIYQSILGSQIEPVIKGINYLYLMLNKRNNLIKIGKSNNPVHREKTLQGEEPEIVLLAYWQAGAEIERKLHHMFKGKRRRGEWFELSFSDVKLIDEYMRIDSSKQFSKSSQPS